MTESYGVAEWGTISGGSWSIFTCLRFLETATYSGNNVKPAGGERQK